MWHRRLDTVVRCSVGETQGQLTLSAGDQVSFQVGRGSGGQRGKCRQFGQSLRSCSLSAEPVPQTILQVDRETFVGGVPKHAADKRLSILDVIHRVVVFPRGAKSISHVGREPAFQASRKAARGATVDLVDPFGVRAAPDQQAGCRRLASVRIDCGTRPCRYFRGGSRWFTELAIYQATSPWAWRGLAVCGG